ncbi:MAG: HyaD/HybD family hydrogenase maturation endopeptidase [Campylobacteraceae bacterium]|jgi:hydrogenase maturation protease|nr:HyaD/HybD family hydrogenase maturation endopeptidase [Campylobacteraceae bacterium]
MKILLLGIGNIMFSDEGVGVHLCRYIQKKYRFTSHTHTLDFIDGGTLAERLIPIIAQYDYVIILDCISADGGEFGNVYFFDFDDIPKHISWQGSAHEVEMLQTLTMMDIVGDRPKTKIIGIIPKVVEGTTLRLTDEIIKGSETMERVLVGHLKELGFDVGIINDKIDIQSEAYKFGQDEDL